MIKDRGEVAVTIPAYNAEPSVGDIVRRTLVQMPQVLVIDDGSQDGTGEAARKAGAEVITHQSNCGKGAALRLAFETLFDRGYKGVLTLDADGQHLPEEIPKLIETWLEGGDMILGCREELFAQMARIRRVSNTLSSRAISWAAGHSVRDVQTGFRIYSSRLIKAVRFPENRFEAESAVVVRAARAGFAIETVPIRLGFADGRCTSHFRPVVDSLRIARAVIAARWCKRR